MVNACPGSQQGLPFVSRRAFEYLCKSDQCPSDTLLCLPLNLRQFSSPCLECSICTSSWSSSTGPSQTVPALGEFSVNRLTISYSVHPAPWTIVSFFPFSFWHTFIHVCWWGYQFLSLLYLPGGWSYSKYFIIIYWVNEYKTKWYHSTTNILVIWVKHRLEKLRHNPILSISKSEFDLLVGQCALSTTCFNLQQEEILETSFISRMFLLSIPLLGNL